MHMCIATQLAQLYHIFSLIPSHLLIVAATSLKWLYSLLYSEHINHIQVLGFLPFPYYSWWISLTRIFSSFIHLVVNDKFSFFFVAEYISIVYKYHIF
jgi:hypothetical protein